MCLYNEMKKKALLYYSLLVSLIWCSLLSIPLFAPPNEVLGYIFLIIIFVPQLVFQHKVNIERRKLKTSIFSFSCGLTAMLLFISLIILNEFIESLYPELYFLKYLVSIFIVLFWGNKLLKISRYLA